MRQGRQLDTLLDTLMLPGQWLFALFFFSGEDHDAAARAALAPWLTLVFGLGVLLILRLVRIAVRDRLAASPHAGGPSPGPQLAPARASAWPGLPRLPRVGARDVWAIVWRAQLVHLTVAAVLPLAWELGRAMLMIVFLPFFIVGFGDRTLHLGQGLEHLREPVCWAFATPCATPALPLAAMGSGWKLLWLLLTLWWCWRWWRGRRRAAANA